ncbi:hypothetical protein JW835_05075 [bacterium]|nr:hypothetical protein [bacterium]
MENPSLLILGSATLDENIIDGKRFRKIGGVPVYAGFTFKKLGYPPSIISNIAETELNIRQFFKKQEIPVRSGLTDKTTTFINEYNRDQRTQQMPCCAMPVRPEQITGSWKNITHLHLGPLHPDDLAPDIYLLDPGSRLVTLDIQGLTRSIKQNQVIQEVSPAIKDALNQACIIKADDSELNLTCQYLNLSIRKLIKQYQVNEIVETLADAGGKIHTIEKSMTFSAHPKKQIKDTTGAGDVFFAAYLFSRIYKKEPISSACRFAAMIAARHIEGNWLQIGLLNTES